MSDHWVTATALWVVSFGVGWVTADVVEWFKRRNQRRKSR